MPSNHLILCCPLLLLPSTFPSIRVFSSESVLCIRWPKYWSFSFSISPSKENSGVCVCVCVCMTNHCAVHLKLTGYCKLIILQFLKMKKKSSPCICEFSVCSCNLLWVNSFNCAFYFKTLFYHGPYWLFTYHSIPAFMCKAQKP